jgi:hypothetical protein
MARSKYEIKCQKELEADNWEIDWKVRPFRCPKGYRMDFFGLFDIVAHRAKDLRFIAVKGHMGVPGKLRKAIEQFFVPNGCTKEIWTYKPDKTVKKELVENVRYN